MGKKKKEEGSRSWMYVCMYVRMYVCLFGALELAGRPPRAWHCILRAGGKLKSSRVESSRVESSHSLAAVEKQQKKAKPQAPAAL